MIAFFDETAAGEYDDAVGHADRGEAVGDQESHLALGEFGKALEHLELAAGIERGGGLVQDEKLRVAEIGAGEGHLLPLAAGELDSTFEAAAEHLVVAAGELAHDGVGEAFVSGEFDVALLMGLIDAADGDVLAGGHLEAHEVLKDDADLAVEIFEGVLAEIDAVEEDLALGGIVEPSDEFDDGGLALAVFADERDAFAGREGEVEVLQDGALGARIGEGDVAKLEALS